MEYVAVISASGKKLMPTSAPRARRLLTSRKAVIYRYRPMFAIQLTERQNGDTQPIEYKTDTGYQHAGVSICSETHEYINEQRDMLIGETERHNDTRKYRRARRSRLRYRKPRFNNRKGKICEDGFAPSIRNRRDIQIELFRQYVCILPVTDAYFEMGKFDTQVLKAIEKGEPIPEGTDYQHGERYGTETLRQAIFSRDCYTCQCCKKRSIADGSILHAHHIGFWKGDRTNRLSNLMTVCEKCHTSKNHQPGGRLHGLEPKLKTFKGATFMTMVRWNMTGKLKEVATNINIHITYGAATKLARQELNLTKSHANDAYSMGRFHPRHRTQFRHFKKQRRNNRVLSKFYDAKYIDTRDNSVKKGSAIGCNRTNRKIPRNNEQNERRFRGQKMSRGRVSTRGRRYSIQSGDVVYAKGQVWTCHGVMSGGTSVLLASAKESPTGRAVTAPVGKVKILSHVSGWKRIL